jgi:hypothetical protein
MYDFAHPLEDALEHITHSLCTLEFENHRPLYDWFIENCPVPSKPRQIEFARLNLTYTVMSKRKLLQLVQEGLVSGWDDPRLPTISGLRRRGYPAEAIRHFCKRIGITKFNGTTDVALLEFEVRDFLNREAPRRMAVLDPSRWCSKTGPPNRSRRRNVPNHPQNPEMGERKVPLGAEIWIEREDFMEDPPKKFYRLGPAAMSACAAAISSAAPRLKRTLTETSPSSARTSCPAPSARTPRKASNARPPSIGSMPPPASMPKSASTTACSASRTPTAPKAASLSVLNPDSLKTITAKVEPMLAEAEAGFPASSNASAISSPTARTTNPAPNPSSTAPSPSRIPGANRHCRHSNYFFDVVHAQMSHYFFDRMAPSETVQLHHHALIFGFVLFTPIGVECTHRLNSIFIVWCFLLLLLGICFCGKLQKQPPGRTGETGKNGAERLLRHVGGRFFGNNKLGNRPASGGIRRFRWENHLSRT